jgi:hypothetical protein
MGNIRWLGFKFEPRDIWIGVYWTSERHLANGPPDSIEDQEITVKELTLYICPLPMILFKIRIYHSAQLGFPPRVR